jgi:hypothetical protein
MDYKEHKPTANVLRDAKLRQLFIFIDQFCYFNG